MLETHTITYKKTDYVFRNLFFVYSFTKISVSAQC